MLPSGGNTEAGSAANWKERGLRLSLDFMRGFNFSGGHDETKGLSPGGRVIQVPRHFHEVELDIFRVELGASFNLSETWQAWARLPYDVKEQQSKATRVTGTVAQRAAAQASIRIHHREQTYRGFSDASLLLANRLSDVWWKGDSLVLAFGISVPIGKTEEDPFKAADRGEKHLHIQFGNGTVDPLLEINYRVPLPGAFMLSAHATGRFPFYENSKSYRGSIQASASLTLEYAVTDKLRLRATNTFFFQYFAYWDGKVDINSGILLDLGAVGASYRLTERASLSLDVRIPIYQSVLGDGDAFEQGPTVMGGISFRW